MAFTVPSVRHRVTSGRSLTVSERQSSAAAKRRSDFRCFGSTLDDAAEMWQRRMQPADVAFAVKIPTPQFLRSGAGIRTGSGRGLAIFLHLDQQPDFADDCEAPSVLCASGAQDGEGKIQ